MKSNINSWGQNSQHYYTLFLPTSTVFLGDLVHYFHILSLNYTAHLQNPWLALTKPSGFTEPQLKTSVVYDTMNETSLPKNFSPRRSNFASACPFHCWYTCSHVCGHIARLAYNIFANGVSRPMVDLADGIAPSPRRKQPRGSWPTRNWLSYRLWVTHQFCGKLDRKRSRSSETTQSDYATTTMMTTMRKYTFVFNSICTSSTIFLQINNVVYRLPAVACR